MLTLDTRSAALRRTDQQTDEIFCTISMFTWELWVNLVGVCCIFLALVQTNKQNVPCPCGLFRKPQTHSWLPFKDSLDSHIYTETSLLGRRFTLIFRFIFQLLKPKNVKQNPKLEVLFVCVLCTKTFEKEYNVKLMIYVVTIMNIMNRLLI